jgi:hypothetical protein
MKCRRVQHLLLDFVDGLGTESLHAEVERHLAVCKACEAFAAESARSLALLRRVPVETLDDNFNWKVRLAIHREEKARAKGVASTGAWVRAWNFRYVASTGVAFALVLGAGAVFMQSRMSPTTPSSSEPVVREAPATSSPRLASGNRGTNQIRYVAPSPGVLVNNTGAPSFANESESRGPIDRFQQEVAMDSVIDARLTTMTPEMRMRCIQRQIHRLQAQLEQQPGPVPATKP